jgi:hypothetical protein
MTTTLTDRYVEATLRRLPVEQRPDIERELRTSIADAVEDRAAAGSDAAEAERAVLNELGDPARLAARYAERPLHLIGPAFYLDYVRLLKALLITVVPVVAVAVGVLRGVNDRTVGAMIGGIIGAGITTAVHIAFWTTVLFVVLERIPGFRVPTRDWTVDQLPEPVSRRARHGDLIAETVAVVVFLAFVFVSPKLAIQTDAAGDPIGVLSPWLWDSGMVYVYAGLALVEVGFKYAKVYLSWNLPVAVADLLVNLATAGLLIWFAATDHLLNPAFADAAGWPQSVTKWIPLGVFVVAALSMVQALVEFALAARRRRWTSWDLGHTIRTAVDQFPGVRRG